LKAIAHIDTENAVDFGNIRRAEKPRDKQRTDACKVLARVDAPDAGGANTGQENAYCYVSEIRFRR